MRDRCPVCSQDSELCGCAERRRQELLAGARWARRLRFTECVCAACVFIGFAVVNEPNLSLPLVFAGAITLTLSRVTSKVP